MHRILWLFILTISLSFPATVHAEIKRLAVLDFTGESISTSMRSLLADQVRSGVITVVDKEQMLVMTRESAAQILKDMGKDPSCMKGSCEVEIARNIGADYVISGAVTQVEDEFIIILKLHDANSNALLATKTADSHRMGVLRKAMPNVAQRLIGEGLSDYLMEEEASRLGFSGSVSDGWSPEETPEGVIYFTSEPEGAIVIVDGELQCTSTPCSKQLPVGVHTVVMQKERYQAVQKIVDVANGETVSLSMNPNFGYVSVSSSASAELYLDGEVVGELPIHELPVDPGLHSLSLQDDCYDSQEYHFYMRPSQTEVIEDYPMEPKVAGIYVSVIDREGNASIADLYVDGKHIGKSPLTTKIPLCSSELEVWIDGRSTRRSLSLQEKEVTKMEVRIGGDSLVSSEGYQAVLIPSGSFQRGCTFEQKDLCDADEGPVQQIKISHDFYIMRSEVTQGLYTDIIEHNPSRHQSCGDDCPVERVRWYDAVYFANQLSRKEGLEECYEIQGWEVTWPKGVSCTGWRLPTEAEWEYAARGPSRVTVLEGSREEMVGYAIRTGESFLYAGGNHAEDVTWSQSNSAGKSHPVCGKKENGYGLCDLSGNVYEWCWDWKGSYSDTVNDPIGPSDGQYRVLRGGSWLTSENTGRVSFRYLNDPVVQGIDNGFRLVRSLVE